MNMNGSAMPSSSSQIFNDNFTPIYPNVNSYANQQSNEFPGLLTNQWPSMNAQNNFYANPHQQQMQNMTPWMQSQGMQNGMPPSMQQAQPQNMQNMMPSMHQNQQNLNGYNPLALLPQSVFQDALRMSAAVGSSPNDDSLLAQALHDSSQNRQTYRQAIESLHGINNHAANLWKDYYLDHKPRIDNLVKLLAKVSDRSGNGSNPSRKSPDPAENGNDPYSLPPSHTRRVNSLPQTEKPVKKPSPRTFATERSMSPKSSNKSRKSSLLKTSLEQKPSRRSTINSLTTHAPIHDLPHLPPPSADLKIPEPPSRSPTPPDEIVESARGNRFTKKDKEYFIKYISWLLKGDPTLTKKELTEKLALKAPHHTALSWGSYWHNQHELADKILAAAHGELSDADGSSDSAISSFAAPRRRGYSPGSSADQRSAAVSVSGSESSSDDSGSDLDDRWDYTSEDAKSMSVSRGAFSDADFRNVSKHVANFSSWEMASGKERWEGFHQRFPGRSAKSWAEYYRRHQKELDRAARKYLKRKNTRSTIDFQRGRPTWASHQANNSCPPPKRKFAGELDDGANDQITIDRKRSRVFEHPPAQ